MAQPCSIWGGAHGPRDVAVAVVDDLLLVVPAELRSMIAARQSRRVARVGGADTARRRPEPFQALTQREVARGLDLPLAGELPDEVTVRVAIQTGEPATLLRSTELAALCQAILVGPAAIGRAA